MIIISGTKSANIIAKFCIETDYFQKIVRANGKPVLPDGMDDKKKKDKGSININQIPGP